MGRHREPDDESEEEQPCGDGGELHRKRVCRTWSLPVEKVITLSVITRIYVKKGADRTSSLSNDIERRDQRLQLICAQPLEPALDRVGEVSDLLDELPALVGNARGHVP